MPDACKACCNDNTYRAHTYSAHVVRGLYNIRILRYRLRECRHQDSLWNGFLQALKHVKYTEEDKEDDEE
jgi:hypothetical protein